MGEAVGWLPAASFLCAPLLGAPNEIGRIFIRPIHGFWLAAAPVTQLKVMPETYLISSISIVPISGDTAQPYLFSPGVLAYDHPMKTQTASPQHQITFPPLRLSLTHSGSEQPRISADEFEPHQMSVRAVVVTAQLREMLAQTGYRHDGLNE